MIVMANDRKKNRHKNPALYLRPHADLRKMLDAYAARERLKVSAVAIHFLMEGLKAQGFWPPPVKPKE
jgi:hypothetical protein